MTTKLIAKEAVREIIRENTRIGSRQELYHNMGLSLFNRICSFVAGKYGQPYDQELKVYAFDQINPYWVMEQFLKSYPELDTQLNPDDKQLAFALVCKSCERQINAWYKEIKSMAAVDFTRCSMIWNLSLIKDVPKKQLDRMLSDYIGICKRRAAEPIKLLRY